MKTKNLAIFSGIFALFALFLASAWGVSLPYWDGYPLEISAGETAYLDLNLQNMAGTPQNMTLRARMVDDGNGIASFVDSDLSYDVPFGTYDVMVPVAVSVPADALNSSEEVVIAFDQVSTDGDGMIVLTTGITVSFPVVIYEVVSEETSGQMNETTKNGKGHNKPKKK